MKEFEGRLVAAPTVKTQVRSSDGQEFPVAYFTVAKTGEDGQTIYADCRATGKLAKATSKFLKGGKVKVYGEEKEYTNKDGKNKKFLSVNKVDSIKKEKEKTKNSFVNEMKEYDKQAKNQSNKEVNHDIKRNEMKEI